MSLIYCRTNDQIIDIFMTPLFESNFVKFWPWLGIQEATIKGSE